MTFVNALFGFFGGVQKCELFSFERPNVHFGLIDTIDMKGPLPPLN